jgi:molybdate transport system ATP-binding protein
MKHRAGPFALDVAFEITAPWTVLFGPSGSGKTTVLRAIAGFVRPDEGRIVSGLRNKGVVLCDTSEGIFTPPHRRPIRMAGQAAFLFPHLSVRENIAFGAIHQSDGTSRTDIANMAITKFHLSGIAERSPAMLSGGERQRVAIARASVAASCVSGGGMLILDEVFTGMDATLKTSLIAELQDWLSALRTPVLSVTHDIAEAFQLADEVIRLENGLVAGQGSPNEVLGAERERLMKQLGG